MAGNWEIGKLKPVWDMNSTNVEKKQLFNQVLYNRLPQNT